MKFNSQNAPTIDQWMQIMQTQSNKEDFFLQRNVGLIDFFLPLSSLLILTKSFIKYFTTY